MRPEQDAAKIDATSLRLEVRFHRDIDLRYNGPVRGLQTLAVTAVVLATVVLAAVALVLLAR